jgi:hypothetical protein
VSDGGIYVLVVAFRILAGTPLLEPYDCKQWRMLLIAVAQGHPSKFGEARGLFVDFPIYNCDPEKLMVNQLSDLLRDFGTATYKLKKQIGFASDQVALVSILYAKADLNLSRLSKNLIERQKQYRDMLQEFSIQHGTLDPAYTQRLQDGFKCLTQLEVENIQRQHQKGSLGVLTSMAFSVSQRMVEDLEAEDSNFRALLTHFPRLPLILASESPTVHNG